MPVDFSNNGFRKLTCPLSCIALPDLQDQLADAAKAAYLAKHVDPKTVQERNGGAHFQFLTNILERNNGGQGFVAGHAISIADIQVR